MLKSQTFTLKLALKTSKPTSLPKKGSTKSSRRIRPSEPVMMAHCSVAASKEQKKPDETPSLKRSSPEKLLGTAAGLLLPRASVRIRPVTRVGSCSRIVQRAKRMQYQPRSPKQPNGSMALLTRMLFSKNSESP